MSFRFSDNALCILENKREKQNLVLCLRSVFREFRAWLLGISQFFLRAHEFIMQRHINSEPVEQGVIRFRRSFGSNFMNFWELKQQ